MNSQKKFDGKIDRKETNHTGQIVLFDQKIRENSDLQFRNWLIDLVIKVHIHCIL